MNLQLSKVAIENPSEDRLSEMAVCVRRLLQLIGDDPDREGLADTPSRVARMYQEIFSGLMEDPRSHLQTQFCDDEHEDIVIVKDITFYSLCEHHLVPFFGKMHVAYVPDGGRLAGLSKIARVVSTLARRPQLQERLNKQVVDTVWEVLKPQGVLALAEAEHMCMAMRGIRIPGSSTVTMVSRGTLNEENDRRAEAGT